jgi:hypothetical protein
MARHAAHDVCQRRGDGGDSSWQRVATMARWWTWPGVRMGRACRPCRATRRRACSRRSRATGASWHALRWARRGAARRPPAPTGRWHPPGLRGRVWCRSLLEAGGESGRGSYPSPPAWHPPPPCPLQVHGGVRAGLSWRPRPLLLAALAVLPSDPAAASSCASRRLMGSCCASACGSAACR